MKQEDKNLLLRDLCARLPYGVKGYVNGGIYTLQGVNVLDSIVEYDIYCNTVVDEFIPYLFPLSSMTEEQIEEAKTYFWKDVDYGKNLVDKGINCFYPCFNILEFYHKHHLDYRGLIPKDLAIDCTNLNIY